MGEVPLRAPRVSPRYVTSARPVECYRGYSKLRTHTAVGPYGSSMPGSIGPSYWLCVSLISSNPCISQYDHHTSDARQSQKSISRILGGINAKHGLNLPERFRFRFRFRFRVFTNGIRRPTQASFNLKNSFAYVGESERESERETDSERGPVSWSGCGGCRKACHRAASRSTRSPGVEC